MAFTPINLLIAGLAISTLTLSVLLIRSRSAKKPSVKKKTFKLMLAVAVLMMLFMLGNTQAQTIEEKQQILLAAVGLAALGILPFLNLGSVKQLFRWLQRTLSVARKHWISGLAIFGALYISSIEPDISLLNAKEPSKGEGQGHACE